MSQYLHVHVHSINVGQQQKLWNVTK